MRIQENISLRPYNTFGINVTARKFARFASVDELKQLLVWHQVSPLILGGGSNILFTKNVDGLVLHNAIGGIEKIREDEEHVYIKAGAGENWHGFVLHC